MENPLHHPVDRVPELIRELYELVGKLEVLFPDRKFTPDGHLVGSIGEVIAAHRYGLTLYAASTEAHDAITSEGRQVEVKATQGTGVALRAEPEHLVVLHIAKDGSSSEVFNGPGALAWAHCGAMQKNGQRPVSLTGLRKLMEQVPVGQRLAVRDDA